MKIQRNLVAKNESVIECDARAFVRGQSWSLIRYDTELSHHRH
jgi:hypothetical protein